VVRQPQVVAARWRPLGRLPGIRTVIRLVIVDDEAEVLEVLAARLAAEPDLEVVGTAGDGSTALVVASEGQPDVVVIDLGLPGLVALTAIQLLRELPHPPSVVGLTISADDDAALDALRAGAVALCTKTDPPDALVRAVRSAGHGESVVPPALLRSLLPRSRPRPVAAKTCTVREAEVLALVAKGANNPEICLQLHISDATVRSHLYHLRAKLDARTRAELVVRAFELGMA
jgi:DNA-binding NarL/FixJ family response regulator